MMATKRKDAAALTAIAAYGEFVRTLEELARNEQANGRPLHARKRAHSALLAFRARRAEDIDPEPRERPDCACANCHLYRMGLR